MVFANLGTHEKQAFFDLLDEYFTSRPELLASLGGSASGGGSQHAPYSANEAHTRAAASAVHSALAANPEATANLVSAGLRHGAQNSSVKNSPFANAAANPAIANSVGRVAAASFAFQRNNSTTPPAPPSTRSTPPPPPAARNMPPALPRRTSSTSQEQEDEDSAPPPPGRAPIPKKAGGASGLLQSKSFGNVDTTSFAAGLRSMGSSKPKGPAAPPVPPSFPKRQNNFAPPPVRRLTSDPPHPPIRTPTPEPEPEPEEEQGEWAESLYEYNSGEQGDLVLQAQQRVKILSRDSEDWWTGEAGGKTGLFPASYVRIL